MKRISKTRLLNKLIEKSILFPLLCPGKKGKVGEVIQNLSEEEREMCKTFTSKDFNGRYYE